MTVPCKLAVFAPALLVNALLQSSVAVSGVCLSGAGLGHSNLESVFLRDESSRVG